MLGLGDKAQREYLDAIGVAAVFVGALDGCCIVRASRDLAQSARALRDIWPNMIIVAAWWVKDREQAEQIARDTVKLLPQRADLIDADPQRAQSYVHKAADVLKVRLVEHATVMKRAALAAGRVKAVLDEANGRGDLAWFNGAYREYRLSRSGRPQLAYAAMRARLAKAMARRLVMVERLEYGPQLLSEVFGEEFCNRDLG